MKTLKIEQFKGKVASVNTYLIYNSINGILIDTTRTEEDTIELIKFIQSKNINLTHILITHGHPDHYGGMPFLKNSFPETNIIVASEEIKNDIISFSNWMNSVGWLENDPLLKPKSINDPNGFDYLNQIKVHKKNTILLDESILKINTNYLPTEASHITTIEIKELNAFITSDFCYNGVHLWLGPGVESENIINWKEQLIKFKDQFKDSDYTFYPGHGNFTTKKLFDIVLEYILAFEETITKSSTENEVSETLKKLYPDWLEADFLLQKSISYQWTKNNK